MLQGQPLHPIKYALQIFTDASKEGWAAHLNEHTARGSWSLPESKLHINYLELKAVFLALKEFQNLCLDKIVLVATENTTVVSYINKEGGMRSGPLCALLWRILTWCTQKQVTLKAQHIPGRLNVVADELSRLGQTIQTEWSLLPEVFQTICNRWNRPQIEKICHQLQQQVTSFCITSTRGMGIVDRSVGRLPTHPHPPKLKEIPKVLLQVSGVPVHLPPIRTSHSPPGLYNDCKGSETNGPLSKTQNSPLPGRLAD